MAIETNEPRGNKLGISKWLEINSALIKLEKSLDSGEDFIGTLIEGLSKPMGENIKEKQLEPPFCQVYSSITERVSAASSRVDAFVQQIRDILF